MSRTSTRRIQSELPWLGILLLIILAIAFLLPVLPNDFWWYLRLGKDILTNGSVPAVDTFSSTVYGQSVSYPMWLSAVFLFGLNEIGGLSAVVLARGILIAVFYALLWLICVNNKIPGWLAALLTLLCALAGANNWAVRPQMFVYPLFGLSLWILTNDRWLAPSPQNDPAPRSTAWQVYLLIPIALLWANIHGSVIVLFLLGVPVFLFRYRSKRFFIILCLSFLVTLINPRGFSLWFDSFNIIGAAGNQFSQEWKPPSNNGWQMNLFFGWLLAMLPLAALSSRRLNLPQWVWLLGFGWMALSGTRYIIWFLAILLILSAALISGWEIPNLLPAPRKAAPFNIIFLVMMLLLPLSLLPGVRQSWWQDAPPTTSNNTPIQSVEWLKQHPELPAPIFNDYIFGSYLIYALPDRPVWIDSRFYPFPIEQWEQYLEITNAVSGWQQQLDQLQIGTLILDSADQPKLILELGTTPGWCQQYQDDQAVIFSRCQP